jgi:hypothetical protein
MRDRDRVVGEPGRDCGDLPRRGRPNLRNRAAGQGGTIDTAGRVRGDRVHRPVLTRADRAGDPEAGEQRGA